MVVADETHSLQITGTGDVLEPHDGIIGALPSNCTQTVMVEPADGAVGIAQPSARAGRTHLRRRAR